MQIEKTLNLEEELKRLDEKIAIATENDEEIDIRDGFVEKAELYTKFNNFDKAKEFYLKAIEKTAGADKKLEYQIALMQLYYREKNYQKVIELLKICKSIQETGGDWEKKNKLIVYEGIVFLLKRELESSANSFVSSINTFNSPEILSFDSLVQYASILGLLFFSRVNFKEKIINNSEVFMVLQENKLLNDFIFSYYNSNYKLFFESLVKVSDSIFENNEFLKPHKNFLLRKSRIVIYSQYLESYKTVRLEKMAHDFGVSAQFIDNELFELISAKKINCKIDKVNGVVESFKSDQTMVLYNEVLRKGDLVIERMHKLARTAQIQLNQI